MKNFVKKIWFLKNKFVYLQCEKEMLSRCEGPKLLGNPTEYNSFRPRFSGSNPEGGTFLQKNTKKVNFFEKKFDFFEIMIYLYIETRIKSKNKVMMSINKHMNIWSNGFKGYCGNSYALVGTDARFDERPSITEVEYVVRDLDEW